MKFFKNKKGFTLVELVVVIAILGILAGIAIPRFMDATASARGAKIVADMRTIESAVSMNYAKTGKYTITTGTAPSTTEVALTLPNLVTAGYLASVPVPPSGKAIIPETNKVVQDPTAYSVDGTTGVVSVNGTGGGTLASLVGNTNS